MATQIVVQTSGGVFTEQNGWPAQGQWRYADYLRLPNDGNRYEIITQWGIRFARPIYR